MTTPKNPICHSISAGLPMFDKTPSIGHIHISREHVYECLGDADGMQGARGSLAWKTHCAECGEPFIVFSNLKSRGFSRRCELHKKAGVRVPREGIHPAAQLWPTPEPEEKRRQKVVTRELPPANPQPANVSDAQHTEWKRQVAAGKTTLNYKPWLAERENLSQFD